MKVVAKLVVGLLQSYARLIALRQNYDNFGRAQGVEAKPGLSEQASVSTPERKSSLGECGSAESSCRTS